MQPGEWAVGARAQLEQETEAILARAVRPSTSEEALRALLERTRGRAAEALEQHAASLRAAVADLVAGRAEASLGYLIDELARLEADEAVASERVIKLIRAAQREARSRARHLLPLLSEVAGDYLELHRVTLGLYRDVRWELMMLRAGE